MNEGKKIKNYSATDIEKYHKGLLSPTEMNEMEKTALEDSFLADALEGYALPVVNIAEDINELKQRVSEKTERGKVVSIAPSHKKYGWLRIAAAVIIIGGSGFLAQKFYFASSKTNHVVANNNNTQLNPAHTNTEPSQNNNDTTFHPDIAIAKNVNINKTTNVNNTPIAEQEKKEAAENKNYYPTQPADIATSTETVVTNNGNAATIKADSISIASVSMPADVENSKVAKPKIAKGNNIVNDTRINESKEITSVASGKVSEKTRNVAAAPRSNIFKGRITDENGIGLPFAKISNPTDNNAGTYTDAKGYFTITYPDTTLNVQIKSLGFDNTTASLHNNTTGNNIMMQEDRTATAIVLSNKKVNTERKRDANMKMEEPEPVDGWSNYDSYIANNLEAPDEFKSKSNSKSGTVEVSFEVNKYGEPVNFRIEKSLCNKCDKEAIRLIKDGPKWKNKITKGNRTTVLIDF